MLQVFIGIFANVHIFCLRNKSLKCGLNYVKRTLPVGVAFKGPAVELAELDGSHVSGYEGAGQLHRGSRVLQERSARRPLKI